MENFFSRAEKLFGLKELDRDTLLYRVMPRFMLEVMRKYFRLEVEGVEHLPTKGPAIVAPNHSGYAGFDAVILANEIRKATGRVPRTLAHHLWFLTQATALPMHKMGLFEATMNSGIDQLSKKHMIILFPEGEYGNFKPTTQRYRLQEFKRGFVRMSLQTAAPIIPTVIIGAEETHINLRQLKWTKYLVGSVLPVPLNVLPLPAKWKIKFLKPIQFDHPPESVDNRPLVHKLSEEIRGVIQKEMNTMLKNRKWIYLK